eukprot:COSAG01_NODE_402_length_17510_cov_6.871575_15_plen_62_part_00
MAVLKPTLAQIGPYVRALVQPYEYGCSQVLTSWLPVPQGRLARAVRLYELVRTYSWLYVWP